MSGAPAFYRGDVRAFSLDKALEFDATFLEDDDHMHDSAIQALGVKLHGALSQEKLNHFFGEVLYFGHGFYGFYCFFFLIFYVFLFLFLNTVFIVFIALDSILLSESMW